jgi:hypothetical protein
MRIVAMQDPLFTAGLIGVVFGLAIVLISVVVILVAARRPERFVGLAYAYIGMAIAMTCSMLIPLSRVTDGVPIVALLPPFAIILVIAFRLKRGASQAFDQYRDALSKEEHPKV